MMKHPARYALYGTAALATALVLGGCSKPAEVPAATPAATVDTVANVNDADVTTNVQTALLRADGLKGQDIAVVTLKGDVRLTGMVDNQAQIDSALAIARAASGVHSIHDELTIRK